MPNAGPINAQIKPFSIDNQQPVVVPYPLKFASSEMQTLITGISQPKPKKIK